VFEKKISTTKNVFSASKELWNSKVRETEVQGLGKEQKSQEKV